MKMKKIFIACASLLLASFIIPSKQALFIKSSIYDFKVDGLSGGTIDFSQFKGKKILSAASLLNMNTLKNYMKNIKIN